MDGCMKVAIFFIIKSFVRYKENVLLNQTYLFVLRFLYFIMLLNHVKFVLQKQDIYLNQCVTPGKMRRKFDPVILKCKGHIRAHAAVATINFFFPLRSIVVLNN